MNRSVLVIDTPESCADCPLLFDNKACWITESIVIGDNKPPIAKDCELKKLPQKTICNVYKYEDYENGRSKGWNDYYDMLTKGVLGTMD